MNRVGHPHCELFLHQEQEINCEHPGKHHSSFQRPHPTSHRVCMMGEDPVSNAQEGSVLLGEMLLHSLT